MIATIRVFVLLGVIGGGLYGVELSSIASCADSSTNCAIPSAYDNQSIENNQNLTLNGSITIQSTLTNFTNNGTLRTTQIISANNPLTLINNGTINGTTTSNNAVQGYITSLTNNGIINGSISILSPTTAATIINTGTMNGISAEINGRVIIDNRNNIYLYNTNSQTAGTKLAHLKGINGTQFKILNYMIRINENQTTFNNFSGYTYADSASLNHNSHLVITGTGVSFNNIAFETNAKITIDFGRDFELGKAYSIGKIITDIDGKGLFPIDSFDRLISKDKDLYKITQNGDSFILNFAGDEQSSDGIVINTPITELYKINIKTINNFFLQSNAIIYPRKYIKAPKKQPYNPHRNRYSLKLIQSNEAFSYKDSYTAENQSDFLLAQNATFRNSQKGIFLQYPRVNPPNNSGYRANQSTNRTTINRTNTTQNTDNYYFALVPFISHNYFYKAGNYQLSGFEGGFIGAFSGKLNYANALGIHFGFSYGSINDKNDTMFDMASVNLMLGLNYKLDLIYDMFIRARGDFFYFANEISTEQVAITKPNNWGLGFSVAFGKDFDFKEMGVLGLELGFDYKALSTKNISIKSALDNSIMQYYNKALYNLIYVDFGLNYYRYFANNFGLNVGVGVRGNLAPKLAKGELIVSDRTLNILIDNDRFLGYANLGFSYMIKANNYAMDFGLNYYGNYGDRSMNNGGRFEWRIMW